MRRGPLLGLALVLAMGLAVGLSSFLPDPRSSSPGPLVRRPDVVLILTDDQRWDTLWAMPNVRSRLAGPGVTFTNAFVTTPLCCPSRASILTGRYAHSHGVYLNGRGFDRFGPNESSTVATWLHAAGYHTGLFGKYLNDYRAQQASAVPAGWDRWMAFVDEPGTGGYSLSVDGALTAPGGYSTDVLRDAAVSFIEDTPPTEPVFAYFAPYAPHEGADPAPRHRDTFTALSPWRPPAYNEADVSDKPRYIRNRLPLTREVRAALDAFRLNQYRSLLAVDDAVGAILDALERTGRLPDTLIVFTSDNGLLWGEHRVNAAKSVPYEESIRVPMVVRYDAVVDRGRADGRFVLNIDLAPTVADLAGVPAPGAEGASLVPLLASPAGPWREDFLIEYSVEGSLAYCGVRAAGLTYVLHRSGEEELYDLEGDPHQLDNRASDPALSDVLSRMRTRLAELCVPPPPGLAVPAGW